MLFILLSTLILADSYPTFTQTELKFIEKKFGKISKNRVLDYQKNINLIKTFPKSKRLSRTNFYLNQLLPQYDGVIQKQEDHWATPKEFLTIGYGDCEDYVIIKYFSLIKLGFDKNKLFITTVREKFNGGHHMVLNYFKHSDKSPLILDNLSFKILNLKIREDLHAELFINETGVYKFNDKNILLKIANHSAEYRELIKRIKREN